MNISKIFNIEKKQNQCVVITGAGPKNRQQAVKQKT